VPRRHGNLGGACVWHQKTSGGHKKTTWRLSCWKLNRSDKTQLPAFKLLKNEPVRQDTAGCFQLVRMIKPACHVATEILEVLASGGKNFWRSQKTQKIKHLQANGGASLHSNLRGGLKVCL